LACGQRSTSRLVTRRQAGARVNAVRHAGRYDGEDVGGALPAEVFPGEQPVFCDRGSPCATRARRGCSSTGCCRPPRRGRAASTGGAGNRARRRAASAVASEAILARSWRSEPFGGSAGAPHNLSDVGTALTMRPDGGGASSSTSHVPLVAAGLVASHFPSVPGWRARDLRGRAGGPPACVRRRCEGVLPRRPPTRARIKWRMRR
jgi:hypothetical protein